MNRSLGLPVLALCLLAPLTQAQDQPGSPPQPVVSTPLDASGIDATQWCVYASALYSQGAIITIGEEIYMCMEEVQEGQGRPRLVWRLVD